MRFTKERKVAYVLLLMTALIWGGALPVVKNSYEETTAFRFLFYRYIFAAIVAVPIIFYYFHRVKAKTKSVIIISLIELIGVTLNLALLYTGLSKTTSIEATLITMAGPFITIVGGIIFLKEKEERNEILGLIIALSGTLLITLLPLFADQIVEVEFSLEGNLMVLGHTLINTIYFILAKKYYNGYPKFYASGVSFIVGLISFFIIAALEIGGVNELLSATTNEIVKPPVFFAAAYMGVLGSVVALTFYIKGQEMIEISEASIFGYLQPVITIPLGVLWLNENLNIFQIMGITLIAGGVIVASVRERRRRRKRRHRVIS
ncbi:MAG: hypothetical protein US52_C0008G0012 [candidate division WS6 bacterium GW2011_GWA2_37_6]|uniref:EamA domain-containing protein n=1 Tax=candidate division WS6 bacterium GW2011_GWA2_37_6 TaxID=1619087 RepID=A0A0G0GYV4_9BACT|nr:MAG: hypothetical protein US52_C0008G0012 [candidate division WS6 bacterium GW2011_GWA2_37_6]